MNENEKEIWERLTYVEQSTKSAHHRIDNIEKLVESVHVLATETKAMREDMNELSERMAEVEKRPARQYDTFITAVVTAVVGVIVGYFLKF